YYGFEAWDTLKARQPEIPVLILSVEKEGKGKNPMLKYLPNSRQVIIPDCGHMSNMEKPEEFTQLILEQFKLVK
ncbi:MAG: alpha/beta hydrolase, partial [Bacteroidales bacterium]|nr:alpha/beta hydrolase [Bacteroidales bacterium]